MHRIPRAVEPGAGDDQALHHRRAVQLGRQVFQPHVGQAHVEVGDRRGGPGVQAYAAGRVAVRQGEGQGVEHQQAVVQR